MTSGITWIPLLGAIPNCRRMLSHLKQLWHCHTSQRLSLCLSNLMSNIKDTATHFAHNQLNAQHSPYTDNRDSVHKAKGVSGSTGAYFVLSICLERPQRVTNRLLFWLPASSTTRFLSRICSIGAPLTFQATSEQESQGYISRTHISHLLL